MIKVSRESVLKVTNSIIIDYKEEVMVIWVIVNQYYK